MKRHPFCVIMKQMVFNIFLVRIAMSVHNQPSAVAVPAKESYDREVHNNRFLQALAARMEADRSIKEYESFLQAKDEQLQSSYRAKLMELKKSSQKHMSRLEEAKNRSQHSLQQHNFTSMSVEMLPRLEELAALATNIQWELMHQYVFPVIGALASLVTYEVFRAINKSTMRMKAMDDFWKHHEGQPSFGLPDFRFFAQVDENGALRVEFDPEFLEDYLIQRDSSGAPVLDEHKHTIPDTKAAEAFQKAFLASVISWLDAQGYACRMEGH